MDNNMNHESKNWWSPIHTTSHRLSSSKIIHSWKGLLTLAVSIHVCMTWMLSGVLINFLSCLLYLSIRPFSVNLYRYLNFPLTYILWSQIVGITEYLGKTRLRIFFKNDETKKYFGKEHSLILANHSFETDWLFMWMTIDKFGVLANGKAMVKSMLRFLPVMGWSWYFHECIFLERNAAKDEAIIRDGIDVFLDHPYPTMTLLYCEGTRPTPPKYQNSVEHAKEKGFEPFRHHLVPRSRGLEYVLKKNSQRRKDGLNGYESVYNVQVAFRRESNEPNMYSLLLRQPILGDVYIDRIPVEKIDPTSHESVSRDLMNIYRQKDDLMDYHKEHNLFPGVEEPQWRVSPRIWPFVNLIIFPGLATIALTYVFFFTNIIGIIVVSSLLLVTMGAFIYSIGQTRAKRGSSYGASKSTKAE